MSQAKDLLAKHLNYALKTDAENAIRLFLSYFGENADRPGLKETPARVVRAYSELLCGYGADLDEIFKVFEDEPCDQMVVVRDVEFMSVCEHHMLPFSGVAHIGYLPSQNRVIGLSKLGRLLDVFAKRLQIQERLTRQITEAMDKHLKPFGSACVVEARHSCMSCRGVRKQQSTMVTSSLTGEFLKPEVRAEFLSLARS